MRAENNFDSSDIEPLTSESQISDATVLQAYHYWEQKRGGRIGPKSEQIQQSEMAAFLPIITLVEPVDGGADFKIVLVGTKLTGLFDHTRAGTLISEFSPASRVYRTLLIFRNTFQQKRPFHAGPTQYRSARQDHMTIETAALPLSEDGKIVSQILTGHAIKMPDRAAL